MAGQSTGCLTAKTEYSPGDSLRRMQNNFQFWLLTSDFWPLISDFSLCSCLKQLTILTPFNIHLTWIFLTCHYLLSSPHPVFAASDGRGSKVQHRPLIDIDRPHPMERKVLKLYPFFVLVNLNLPARTICTKSTQDFAHRKAKIQKLHHFHLYQISNSLVK